MSRSYREPLHTQGYGTKSRIKQKKVANHKVRHTRQAISDGASFKKLYDSYNICDFKLRKRGNPSKNRSK